MNEEEAENCEITSGVKKQYASAFAEFGVDKKSLFWPKGRQEIRFEKHLSAIEAFAIANLKEFSIIDYGCGFSDLYSHILSHGNPVSKYFGVDILKNFLEISGQKFPNNQYYERSVFVENKEVKADVVCAIGTFSMRYVPRWEDNYRFVLSEIEILWERTKLYLSVDFMTDQVDFMQLNSFHVNPHRIVSDLQFLLRPTRIELIESNIPFEFLVQIWK